MSDMNKEGWEVKKLGDIFETSSGGTPSKDISAYYENGTINWLRSGEVNQRNITHTELKITELGLKNSSAKLFPKETVVIAMYGATVGQVGLLQIATTTNQAVCGILPNNRFNSAFLYYFLKSKKEYFISISMGGAQPNISQTIIKNTQVPIPLLPVQSAIVAELDSLYHLKELQEQQLEEYDKLAQSTFYAMFGDPIENEKGWEVKKFSIGVEEMHLGPFGSALKNDCFVSEEVSYCMVYEQKHAIRKTLDVETRYIDAKKYNELKRFEVKAGDFLMSCRGTIGEIYRLPKEARSGIIHPSLMKIKINENIYNPIFFEKLLYEIIQKENTQGTGVKMAITAKALNNKKIALPPFSIQNQFAERIEKIEAQKELVKQSITQTEQLINYTMDKYFG